MLIFTLFLIPALSWFLLQIWPLPGGSLGRRPPPRPTASYEEAVARLDGAAASEAELALHPLCGTRLWLHGRQTERVALLLHGYTNCPQQLAGLGDRLYAQGWNVFAPRMPLHGLADRLTDELGGLTAEALADWAEESLDIACGLGHQVRVFGFSAGGGAALWLAQIRPQVERAVVLSAFLGIRIIPTWLHRPFVHVFLRLPNRNLWWDPARKEASPYSAEFAYPRFSLLDVAQMLRLGAALEALARRQPPAARQVVVMVNQTDPSVSSERLLRLARTWQRAGAQVDVDCFRATTSYMHDVITPGMPGAPVDEMYARIGRWMVAAIGSG